MNPTAMHDTQIRMIDKKALMYMLFSVRLRNRMNFELVPFFALIPPSTRRRLVPRSSFGADDAHL
eukprot:scaffold197651_cov40-Prasinocladus_malaysianus.AAC.1